MRARLYLLITSRREEGCFGVVFDGYGKEFAVFLMRTFANRRTVLNPGVFRCISSYYDKGGYPTFEILISGHTDVLFHKLNWEYQSEGCVGLGEAFEILNGKHGIAQSGAAFGEFMRKYGHFKEFTLEVKESTWPAKLNQK